MSETQQQDGAQDPFSPEYAPAMQLIVQMRIYDVLMALLAATDSDKADALLEIHSKGALMCTAPAFNGHFVTDELNATDNG